jgi:DNA polymerase-3 subunit delta'
MEPCGECKSCKLCHRLEHPDLHWYFPLPRPKNASTPEKLKDALEAARFDRLTEIREQPLQPSIASAHPTGLYLAIAQSLRSRAQRRPAMGSRQVFLIGEAEALVPQEASPEAANALLKLLEEPPHGTHLMLTSNQPGRLLDTIRSRTLPIHVPPLPTQVVRDFLVHVAKVSEAEAGRAAELSGGSIGRALGFVPDGDEKGALEVLRQDAFRLLSAVLSSNPGPGYRHALGTAAARARTLLPLLEFVETALRDMATVAAEAPQATRSSDARDFMERVTKEHSLHPTYMAEALECVEQAKQMAAGNVNPQLVVAGLTLDLRRVLLREYQDPRPISMAGI